MATKAQLKKQIRASQEKKSTARSAKVIRKSVKSHKIVELSDDRTRKVSLLPELAQASSKAISQRKMIRGKIMRGEASVKELDKLNAWHGTKVQAVNAEFSTHVKGKEKRYNTSKAPSAKIKTQSFSN